MEAVAGRLTEARLFRQNTQHLCRLSLVSDDPGNPVDVFYFVSGGALGRQVSGRVLNLAKLARASLGPLAHGAPVRRALALFPRTQRLR
eukprot:4170798-Alexandrium_andersonii.AAC.1